MTCSRSWPKVQDRTNPRQLELPASSKASFQELGWTLGVLLNSVLDLELQCVAPP
jgi:hypothetical protein